MRWTPLKQQNDIVEARQSANEGINLIGGQIEALKKRVDTATLNMDSLEQSIALQGARWKLLEYHKTASSKP